MILSEWVIRRGLMGRTWSGETILRNYDPFYWWKCWYNIFSNNKSTWNPSESCCLFNKFRFSFDALFSSNSLQMVGKIVNYLKPFWETSHGFRFNHMRTRASLMRIRIRTKRSWKRRFSRNRVSLLMRGWQKADNFSFSAWPFVHT